jgi:hypothetical protein
MEIALLNVLFNILKILLTILVINAVRINATLALMMAKLAQNVQ